MSNCCNNCDNNLPCLRGTTFRPESQNQALPAHAIPSIQLAPNSGLFINSAGQLDIDCAILGAKCCWPVGPTTPSPTPYSWSVAPASILEGQQVTINVSGLLPFALFTVRMTPGIGPEEYIPLKADANGNVVNAKVRLSIAQPAVIFTPVYAGGVPAMANFSVEVRACGEVTECTCQGAVTVTPFFSNISVASGQPTTLMLVVKNTNSCPVTSFNLPALVLPANFTSLTPVSITNATILGKSSRTFEFALQVQNVSGAHEQASVVVPSSSATFTCSGNSYSAGGGSVTLTIAPATGSYCGLSVTQFAFTIDPVPGGGTPVTTLTVSVRNLGSSPITGLTMPDLSIGGANVLITSGSTTIGFPAVPTLAPGATHTVSVTVAYSPIPPPPITHTVTIPAGYVYGTCNGSIITNGTARSAVISLT
jgi:hypothetical protein